MSDNIHPNPCLIFPCSVCAGNVTKRGKSVKCFTCSKWVHLKCSQLSLSKFRALGSSYWSCFLCRNTVIPSWVSSNLYTSTVLPRPTLVSKSLILHLRILYRLPLPPHDHPLFLIVLLHLLPPLHPVLFSIFPLISNSLADLAGTVFSLLFYQATMGPQTLVSPREQCS